MLAVLLRAESRRGGGGLCRAVEILGGFMKGIVGGCRREVVWMVGGMNG